jgi:FKBP-type peptidyl-prolyl cis-trans isomerase SlyD
MSDAKTIAVNKVVGIHYVLTDGKGKVLDQSNEALPMYYLQGKNNIVRGLEKALAGKSVGDHVSTVVLPEEGYGRRQGKPQKMRRSEFPDDAIIERGQRFTVRTREDKQIPIWITKVMGATITVDHNHPLAGVKLHFEVDVLSLRDATEEELAHGHAHGADGHGHGHGDGEEEAKREEETEAGEAAEGQRQGEAQGEAQGEE